jgi:hypothetical protein
VSYITFRCGVCGNEIHGETIEELRERRHEHEESCPMPESYDRERWTLVVLK